MAEFKVDTNQLQTYSNQLNELQRQMSAVAVQMTGLQIGSLLRIKASTALIGKITDCKWATVNQASNLGKLARGLDDVAALYERNERNLTEPKTQAQADAALAVEEGDLSFFDFLDGDFSLETLIGWLGKKSLPFSLIAALTSFADGDAKGVVSGLKNLLYAVGNGTKAIFGSSGVNADWLPRLFGLNAQGVGGLGDSWQKFLDSMNVGNQATAAGKVASLAKWAGYALTFVSSGIENFGEFGGDWGNARFWGETLIEGGTDIALSIGAGILVAAALPASAPAIIVGAAGAGVVWLGNEVCEYFTGQDVAEWVSDLVYGDGKVAEVREWVGDRLNEAGEAIQDFGEAAWEAGENLVESAGEAIQDFGEGVAEGASNLWNGACEWAGSLFG